MELCPRCNGFAERIYTNSSRDYKDLACQLMEIVQQGTFLLVHATCPLDDLLGELWPDDLITHDFQCTTCGRAFKLHADTYHGSMTWEPVD